MPSSNSSDLALVLAGGGARAAHQVGFLRAVAKARPDLQIPILTGVSAGALNAAYLAAHPGRFVDAVEGLAEIWRHLDATSVFRTDAWSLGRNVGRWALRLLSGGRIRREPVRSLVDPAPLRELLGALLGAPEGPIPGIAANLQRGRLQALALTGLDYTTGQTVTWVQGRSIELWDRPHRRSAHVDVGLDHILASASLPLVFPAVEIDGHWYGDGGVRHSYPLSPALHLGASRILAVSPRYTRSLEEAARPDVVGYPPPAQILGQLLNAVFLDALDQDVLRTQRINALLTSLAVEARQGLRPVDVLVLRPSTDLARLAAGHEVNLPRAFRFLTRGWGTQQTETPDFLSLLMFEPGYLQKLLDIGEADAESRLDEILALVDGPAGAASADPQATVTDASR